MSAPRFGRFQKATTLLPLALLSTAATASLAGIGPTTAVAGQDRPSTLPDGTAVPTEAIEAPASVSAPGVVAPGLDGLTPTQAVSGATASGIPAAALAAYQRAETVINAADESCRLPWQLVAAIGRVESDHGRVNGNTLDDDGVATPGIYGIALNGRNDTRAIRDTDAGQYDADARWDRAVGPMQFIPSTWSVVGVDGDNDGKRNPQDIDDAALASAVYLCSGKDDLSGIVGQRAAVFRYNHSHDYVDLVLSFMNAYMSGDFTAVPNAVSTSTSGFFAPLPEPREDKDDRGDRGPRADGPDGGTGGVGVDDDGTPDGETTPPPDEPDGDPDGDDTPNLPAPDLPEVDDPQVDDGTVKDAGDKITEAAASTLCLAEVGADSIVDLVLPGQQAEYDECMAGYGY